MGGAQNISLIGMGSIYHSEKIVRLDAKWTHFNQFPVR